MQNTPFSDVPCWEKQVKSNNISRKKSLNNSLVCMISAYNTHSYEEGFLKAHAENILSKILMIFHMYLIHDQWNFAAKYQ